MRKTSLKYLHKNQTLRASDFPYPIERTESGSLYGRLPSGQLVRLDKEKGKGKK